MLETMAERDERLMGEALEEARRAAREGEVPVGAVVALAGRIIARTHNLTERLRDVTAHAEMLAITSASEYLNGKFLPECTLYVTVEPCSMCAGAIGWARFRRVVYGASDPRKGFTRLYADERGPLHPDTELTSGVLAEECASLMREFFRGRRK